MRKFFGSLVGALLLAAPPAEAAPALDCPSVGQWLDPSSGKRVSADTAIARMSSADVILLGESHGFADIQLWQAATAASVATMASRAQFAYEMFPRSAQPALDAWAEGSTSRVQFLQDAGWTTAWGFGVEAYDPILRLPRIMRTPAIALNVDRQLVRRTRVEGWAAIPKADREGVSDPAPALPAYKSRLNAVMSMKADGAALSGEKTAAAKGHSASMGKGFIEAQLVWDRAFAEAIHGAMDRRPGHSVIAFMGRGHVEYNHGVVHQLADLGVFNTATAIAVFPGPDCSVDADADGRPIADLVYGLPEPFVEHVPKPRIGVFIKQAEGGGAEITRISPDSPAERAGFMAGDIVTEAAGHPMKRASDLGTAIRRHTWGAWLPFTVKRGDETLELVAKLPTAPPS